MAVTKPGIATDQDQTATFVELFFDLVFVFAVTQVAHFLHDDLSWAGVGGALLLFWLVWWSWTQFSWALNSADTTHQGIELSLLAATIVAFGMAVKLPEAFAGAGGWFAGTYIAMRLLGLGVYAAVARQDRVKSRALATFTSLSLLGLIAVAAGGYAEGTDRKWLWALAIALDLIAAALAGRREGWDIRPHHFGERHGLFVIIVLGEALIVAGSVISEVEASVLNALAAGLAVSLACGLWWIYFAQAKPAWDAAVAARTDAARTVLARDIYSIGHFPLIFGMVLVAVSVEEVVGHPDDTLPAAGALALGGGVLLFTGSTSAVLLRAGLAAVSRLAIALLVVAALFAVRNLSASWSLVVAVAGMVAIGVVEKQRPIRAG